jgi:hypothetical protein
VHVCVHTNNGVGGSQGTTLYMLVSPHLYVGSRDYSWVARLVWQVPLPNEPLYPCRVTFYFCFCLSESEFQFSKHNHEFRPWPGRRTTAVEVGRYSNQPFLPSILEIIDDLANLVENTDEKLRTEARRVTLVDRKSTSCGKRWQLPLPVAYSSLSFPCCF